MQISIGIYSLGLATVPTQAVYSRMGNVSSPRKLLIHNRKLMKDIEEMKIVLAEILLELNSEKKEKLRKTY